MFCKNCGKEIEDGIKFCPECGASQNTIFTNKNLDTEENRNPNSVGKINSLCIAGVVVTVLSFCFDYYGIACYTAFILSILGYFQSKKNNQKGTTIAIICMAISGVCSLINIIQIVNYARYESATYGATYGFLGGLLDILDDL